MTEDREISLVIGTAGHIDHGKTTLVNALTGVDCDRLLEEKKRGITIELGFAPLKLGDGRVVSVIDVPGHERFIRQMAAGAAGIDAVMLVVAADESVMPQTREHLAILELLGVKDGLAVITKTDRAEPGMAELVEEDVKNFVRGTFLEGKRIVAVSAMTGDNIDVLRKELTALVDRVRPRSRAGAFFLPIDRAFSIQGFGTVVTGTAYRGSARLGDDVEILPAGADGKSRPAKVRSLQVHSRAAEEAFAGQRVAANLAGVAVNELSRGDVVCRRGVYAETRRCDVILKLLRSAAEPLKHWQRVRVCVGTSDVLARVSLLDRREVKPGEEAAAQLAFEEGVVCVTDQHFIIRFYSPLVTIGGGRVVAQASQRVRGIAARRLTAERVFALSKISSPEERLAFLIGQAGVLDFDGAAAAMQETPDGLSKIAGRVLRSGGVLELKGEKPVYLSRPCFDELRSAVAAELQAYHQAHASEPGMPLDDLARVKILTQALPGKSARLLALLMAETGALALEDGMVRLSDFTPKDDSAFRKNGEALFAFCRERAFQPPTLDEARDKLAMDSKSFQLLIQSLKNARRLALTPGGYLLTDEVENDIMQILRKMEGGVTLAAVRDATGSSRKFILPILEYFDSKGYTRRVVDRQGGDVRVFSAQRRPE